LPTDGVDLIDKHYAWAVFLRLVKQVPDAGSAYADKHFDEVGAADAEKGDAGFPG
jgi:hypothetical protein